LLALAGFGSNLLMLHLLNGLAFVAGQLAGGLLGMSDTSLRLEEAKARAEQERMRAEQAEQRRRELVVNVSHELRAPVASVSGHLESLLLSTENGTKAPTPSTLYSYLSIAYQEARRLGMLVDDLLSLARMESHELRLDMREVAASEVIEEVYQTLASLAQRERQVTLVRGVQPNLPPILADHQRLVQVLTNLARNAITSTPSGGIVSLSLESADQQHLALIVEDNGVGIPADELPRIFDRLYRTDASRSRATGGFGLGLAIVHDLVTAMGGSIRVESAVGQGSRFSVLLRCSPSL
jgi:signal transduction histidine kinase